MAWIEGTDPELKDEYLLLSAHYDHVGVGTPDAEGDSIYNGARDNAVGTVAVMNAAKYFAKKSTETIHHPSTLDRRGKKDFWVRPISLKTHWFP